MTKEQTPCKTTKTHIKNAYGYMTVKQFKTYIQTRLKKIQLRAKAVRRK